MHLPREVFRALFLQQIHYRFEDCTCIQATGNAKFRLVKKRIRSLFPFARHFEHYLGIETPRYFVLDRKREIHSKLMKALK